MQLHSLEIENYRAIRRAFLSFNDSIAIIGENDCGKSSILDALQKILDANLDAHQLFTKREHYYTQEHVNTASTIKISVTFKEKTIHEWNASAYEKLQSILPQHNEDLRKLKLTLHSTYNPVGVPITNWTLTTSGKALETQNAEIIKWVRKNNPILRLSAGLMTGHGVENIGNIPQIQAKNNFPAHLQADVYQIQASANILLSQNSMQYLEDIDKGYRSSLRLNEFLTAEPGFESLKIKVRHNYSRHHNDDENHDMPEVLRSGSPSEKLGVILLMAALIRGCADTVLHEVDPIWIIEDPEAHLHKMTLASVSEIFDGIKGQKILTTNSGALLASVPLKNIRRLVLSHGNVSEYKIKDNSLSSEEIRKIDYHIRSHRNTAFFSRVWLLVEGETEFWLIPQFARLLGYHFALEGISCVEYAQCGLRPLLKVAKQMNIHCVVLADGDPAGRSYAAQASEFIDKNMRDERILFLPERDIENYLWVTGYADAYLEQISLRKGQNVVASQIINRAIKKYSKPQLALSILEYAHGPKSPGVPSELKKIITYCVNTARSAFD